VIIGQQAKEKRIQVAGGGRVLMVWGRAPLFIDDEGSKDMTKGAPASALLALGVLFI